MAHICPGAWGPEEGASESLGDLELQGSRRRAGLAYKTRPCPSFISWIILGFGFEETGFQGRRVWPWGGEGLRNVLDLSRKSHLHVLDAILQHSFTKLFESRPGFSGLPRILRLHRGCTVLHLLCRSSRKEERQAS